MAWTTTDLLASVRNRAMLPDASVNSYGNAVLLGFASEELLLTVVGMILGVRQNYYSTYVDTAVQAGVAQIPIPSRAIGGAVSAVLYIYNGGVRQLHPIDAAMINTTVTAAYPSNFYFQNNSIILYPTPTSAQGTVRQLYFQRPSRLEQTANCAQVTSVDTNALTVTCSGGVPSAWTTGTSLDFIPQTASQATPYGLGSAATGVSGSVITFASLPTNPQTAAVVAAGDWVALAEYTPIPEVPFEFQVVLAQATAVKVLEAQNDQSGLAAAGAKLAEYIKGATLVITPRDSQGQKKVISPWRRF